ncbi:hypothetical protein [Streptomyces tanashiensis]|uniref:hypothetical protein n=1 Tax=Streptomyces tanashiensis TaxID=67367 RepID=UPI00167EDAF9|nr:hypothetical protein [Streptomyces tanashiensis]GGY04081.1 hypothetical protein GCM10010299_03820 [Streptomyces tanashiensis]
MISEPELVGGVEFDAPEVLSEAPPPRPPRARRPWLWALGGAVLASAVWGGGLYAYGQKKEPGPDLGGYRTDVKLCEAAKLKALGGILGKRSADGDGPEMNEPAVYEASCSMVFGDPDAGYSATVTYTLHKVMDPGHEFAARAKYYGLGTSIGGLGEEAFFDDNGGEGGELRVLDGQVEIALSIYRQYGTDADGKPLGEAKEVDLSGIDVPMTEDMLSLMAVLKK